MQSAGRIYGDTRYSRERSITPPLVMMGVAVAIGMIWFILSGDVFSGYPNLFLVPWVAGLAVVLAAPSVYLYYKGRFSFADPLVFATWSYFFPAFVLGGLFFAVGWSQPEFISFVQDIEYTLPLTIALVSLGFAGLTLGYLLPIGERLGGMISRRLPAKNVGLRFYRAPGILLLTLGVINTAIAFALGVFGYQRQAEFSQYDGLIFMTTLFWMQGSFLLCLLIFKTRKPDIAFLPAIVLLVSTGVTRILFAGNRGTIVQIFAIVLLAFIMSGRAFKMKQAVISGALLVVFLIFGMIYGTTFRSIKGSESVDGIAVYTENVITTFSELERSNLTQSVEYGLSNLAGRVDIVTTLAVVVSNYEALKPYEEAYGLDNNIWIDSTTFFIPRFLWSDKPAASDPRRYSDLYFNFGESSFAITPIGDLLRNFGIIGIPIGMLILGIILRMIYRTLVERQAPVIWRLVLYFMLLMSVSYEGFFGTIIPHLFKVAFVAVIGILIVNLIATILSRRSDTEALQRGATF